MHKVNERDEQEKFFCATFGVDHDELESFRKYYNSDFSAYDNSVYENIASRVTHWWNFEEGDWFAERINLYLDYVARRIGTGGDVVLVDVGYSVPYLYTRPELVKSSARAIFLDKEESASKFFEAISECQGIHRTDDVSLICDIERQSDRDKSVSLIEALVDKRSPDVVLIVASEVVEHLEKPEGFWHFVSGITLPPGVQREVYVTLPVGRKIPSHTMEFLTADDAMKYLSQYMDVRVAWALRPPVIRSEFLTECLCVLGSPKSIESDTA